MSFDGKIGHLATKEANIFTGDHPPVILTGMIVTVTQATVWPAGTILTRDDAGLLKPWDGNGTVTIPQGEAPPLVKVIVPAGVLTDDTNPAATGAASYLAHGTAILTELKLAGGSAPDAAALHALAQAGGYGV